MQAEELEHFFRVRVSVSSSANECSGMVILTNSTLSNWCVRMSRACQVLPTPLAPEAGV